MSNMIRLVVAFLGMIGAGTGHAQTDPPNYPNRAVRVIVPYPPGGPTDLIARLLAQKFSEHFGQTFYVENLTGAAGNIATNTAARAVSDGHTILITTNDFAIAAATTKISYDPIKDFAPISIVAAAPQVVIVNSTLPIRSMRELLDLAKAEPGKYTYAGMPIGFGRLTAARMFKLGLGVDMIFVPFPGAAPLVTSVVGGHTPIAFIGLPPAAPMIKEGKLRALAVTSAKRAPELPEVPTTAEAGFPGQESDLIIGLVAPAGTPRPIVDALQRQVVRAMSIPEVKQKLDTVGFSPVASTPDAYAAQISSDLKIWPQVAKDLGLKVE